MAIGGYFIGNTGDMMGRLFARHFWVINLLFIAAAAWLAAHIFAITVKDQLTSYPRPSSAKTTLPRPAEKSEAYDRYAPITERNIFNPSEKRMKLLPLAGKRAPGVGATEGSEGAKNLLPGGYKLVGTIIGPKPHSWAILQEGADRKQRIVRIHGNIDDGKIVQISRNRILIQRQGKEEVISFSEEEARPRPPGSPPPASGEVVKKLSANRFLVNREDVSSSVSNINQFMTQARIRPHFAMGRPSGFSVAEIQPGSLMEKLGLRNNDVVKKVNGQAINRPEDVFQAYSQLQRDSNIELEIERDGRSEVLRYEIR